MKVAIMREWDVEPRHIRDTVIEMAGFGINYWASKAVVDTEAMTYTITYQDQDYDWADRSVVLTYQKILEAMVEVAFSGRKYDIGAYISVSAASFFYEIDQGNEYPGGEVDSEVADVVIQVALFGEVVFG